MRSLSAALLATIAIALVAVTFVVTSDGESFELDDLQVLPQIHENPNHSIDWDVLDTALGGKNLKEQQQTSETQRYAKVLVQAITVLKNLAQTSKFQGPAKEQLVQLTNRAESLLKQPKTTEELNQYDTNIDSIIHDVPLFVESLGDTPNQVTTGDLPQQRTKSIEADNIVSDVFTDRLRSYKEPAATEAEPSNFIDWLKDDKLDAPQSVAAVPNVKYTLGNKIDSIEDALAPAPESQAHGNMYPDIGLYGQIPKEGLPAGDTQQVAESPAAVAETSAAAPAIEPTTAAAAAPAANEGVKDETPGIENIANAIQDAIASVASDAGAFTGVTNFGKSFKTDPEAEKREAEEKAAEEKREADEAAAEEKKKAEEAAAAAQKEADEKAAQDKKDQEDRQREADEKAAAEAKEAADKAKEAEEEKAAEEEERKEKEEQKKSMSFGDVVMKIVNAIFGDDEQKTDETTAPAVQSTTPAATPAPTPAPTAAPTTAAPTAAPTTAAPTAAPTTAAPVVTAAPTPTPQSEQNVNSDSEDVSGEGEDIESWVLGTMQKIADLLTDDSVSVPKQEESPQDRVQRYHWGPGDDGNIGPADDYVKIPKLNEDEVSTVQRFHWGEDVEKAPFIKNAFGEPRTFTAPKGHESDQSEAEARELVNKLAAYLKAHPEAAEAIKGSSSSAPAASTPTVAPVTAAPAPATAAPTAAPPAPAPATIKIEIPPAAQQKISIDSPNVEQSSTPPLPTAAKSTQKKYLFGVKTPPVMRTVGARMSIKVSKQDGGKFALQLSPGADLTDAEKKAIGDAIASDIARREAAKLDIPTEYYMTIGDQNKLNLKTAEEVAQEDRAQQQGVRDDKIIRAARNERRAPTGRRSSEKIQRVATRRQTFIKALEALQEAAKILTQKKSK